MSLAIELRVSGPRDPTEARGDAPSGVSVARSTTSMGAGGLDVLTLELVIETAKVALPVVATWLYDTFRSKRSDGKHDMHLTVNGNLYVVADEEALARILESEAGG